MQKRRRTGSKRSSDTLEDTKNLPVYCICRSTDGERFMIACDRCEEWYHGDCINVTPKQAEQIKTFYCHQCRRKDPTLDIEYKTTRFQRAKVSKRALSPGSSSSAYADQPSPIKPSKAKKNNQSSTSFTPHDFKGKLSDERSSPSHSYGERKFTPSDTKVSPASIIDGFSESAGPNSPSSSYLHRNYWPRDQDQFKYDDDSNPNPNSQTSTPAKMRPCFSRLRSCGSCSGCTQPEDCGKCDYCRDRRKFGGPNRMRQKCRLRQCVGGPNLPRNRNPPNTTQGLGSRRRKQQTLQGVLLGPHSPSRLQQYTDFDDEQFEVPIDFSPRPYIDPPSSGIYNQHINNHGIPIGSKMRRGDHRLQPTPHDLDIMSSRPYQRLGVDGEFSANSLSALILIGASIVFPVFWFVMYIYIVSA
ncbi:PHD finger and CXXC domain-containing protein [Fasciolopsis buskii]|uniref:CXXC-type zinc finger protein 1 n=1 Tax=Fasciolopsis buskii TaxID=27845 RepID=A0A8E0VJ64_9TREM|nr:PHD finger and CXXC domain-containing protein [Fasciolopsis buski]